MNKRVIMVFAMVGATVGGFVPALWGDDDFFGAAGLLLGVVGGLAGVWLGVWLSKRYL